MGGSRSRGHSGTRPTAAGPRVGYCVRPHFARPTDHGGQPGREQSLTVVTSFVQHSLTPTRFLERAGDVFADRLAIIDGDHRLTYAEFRDRVHRLTGVLADLGVRRGDRVAVLCSN